MPNVQDIERVKREGRFFSTSLKNRLWLKSYPVDHVDKSDVIPTIFVHGFSGSSFPFEKFFDYFKKHDKPVIIYDQRGHGFSGKIDNCDYRIELFCKDLKDLIDSFKLKKVNLVGHCFGGMVSLKFCKLYPEYVNSLVVIGTDAQPGHEIKNKLFHEILVESEILLRDRLKELYYHRDPGEVDYSKFLFEADWYIPRMLEDFEKTSVEVMYKALENILMLDLTDDAKEITVPTLIIHGKKDSVFSVKKAYLLKSLIKKSKLKVFSKANHVNIVIDKNSVLPKYIYSFLDRKGLFTSK